MQAPQMTKRQSNETSMSGKNTIFFVMLLWVIFAFIEPPLFYVLFGFSVIYWAANRAYIDLFVGFILVLILGDNFHSQLKVFNEIRYIYLLAMLVIIIVNNKQFLPYAKVHYLFFPFLFVALICSLFNDNIFLSFQKSISYALLFFIIPQYIHYHLRNGLQNDFFKKLINTYLLLLYSGFILIFFYRPFVFSRVEFRYNGLMGNPNGLGLFCTLALMSYVLIKEYYPEVFNPLIKFLFIFGIAASLILSDSRTSILSSLFFITIYALQKKNYSFLILPVYLIGTFILVFNIQIQDIVALLGIQKYFRLETLNTGSGRFVAWNYAYSNIQSNILLGKGMGYTEQLFQKAAEFEEIKGSQGNAHNSFLTIWLDTGLFGLSYFLLGFYAIIRKAYHRSFLIIPVMVVIGITGFYESWLSASLSAFTFQLIIMLTLFTSDTFFKGSNENI
jgi:O-antigen ligase